MPRCRLRRFSLAHVARCVRQVRGNPLCDLRASACALTPVLYTPWRSLGDRLFSGRLALGAWGLALGRVLTSSCARRPYTVSIRYKRDFFDVEVEVRAKRAQQSK